jgi:hypothetical protein
MNLPMRQQRALNRIIEKTLLPAPPVIRPDRQSVR